MNKKGLILIFITALISGVSIFLNKYSVSVINPYIFTLLKNVMVALALGGIFLAALERRTLKNLTKKQWLTLGLIGLVGGGVPFLMFFKGLSLTSAAQGSFIHKTMFIYVAIMAVVFLKEKISKNFLIGAMLLILGNLLLLKKMPVSFGAGDMLVFGATLLWAIENVISKYLLTPPQPSPSKGEGAIGVSAKIVAWGRMTIGSVFILGYLGFSGQLGPIVTLSIQQIGWTAITAGLLFGFVLTWYSGLKYVPVSSATAILMFGSSVTTMLSLASGASVSMKEIIGGVSIMIGIVLIVSFGFLLSFLRKQESRLLRNRSLLSQGRRLDSGSRPE